MWGTVPEQTSWPDSDRPGGGVKWLRRPGPGREVAARLLIPRLHRRIADGGPRPADEGAGAGVLRMVPGLDPAGLAGALRPGPDGVVAAGGLRRPAQRGPPTPRPGGPAVAETAAPGRQPAAAGERRDRVGGLRHQDA